MEIILYDVVFPKLFCVFSNFVKIICIFFTPSKKLKLSTCVYTLYSDEVVSLISGDYSVVGSPMQWMLQSMCCYKTVDLY